MFPAGTLERLESPKSEGLAPGTLVLLVRSAALQCFYCVGTARSPRTRNADVPRLGATWPNHSRVSMAFVSLAKLACTKHKLLSKSGCGGISSGCKRHMDRDIPTNSIDRGLLTSSGRAAWKISSWLCKVIFAGLAGGPDLPLLEATLSSEGCVLVKWSMLLSVVQHA